MKEKPIPKKITRTILLSIFFICSISFAATNGKKIKVGDVIEIVVYGQEDLSRIVKVSEEGTINFPFIQNIPVDGLSLNDLHDVIVVALSKFSVDKKPVVTLRFLNTYPITVTVLGQVKKPGTYQTSQNSTVQGAIGEAGGFLPGAQLSEIQLIRTSDSSKTIIPVNIEKFILEADVSLLPALKDEDVIFVPGWVGANSVKIAGEVKEAGNYEVFGNLQNVLDIIFKAGGATDDADLTNVLLYSPKQKSKTETRINIEANLENQNYDEIPSVQPGDVIYIPKKRKYWKSFVSVMRDITTFATLYIIFRYGRKY